MLSLGMMKTPIRYAVVMVVVFLFGLVCILKSGQDSVEVDQKQVKEDIRSATEIPEDLENKLAKILTNQQNAGRLVPTEFPALCGEEQLKPRLPTALLIGERKTGTSATLKFLRSLNPKIKTAIVGEPHFFDSDQNHKGGSELYRLLMQPSCPDDIVIEKTPSYFRTPGVMERIFDFNSSVRLMLSLRDPITRAISDYYFEIRRLKDGYDHGRNHDTRVEYSQSTFAELAILETGEVDASFGPVKRSLYDISLERWLTKFNLSQFHIIDADNFAKNPVIELRAMEAFLGVQPQITSDMVYFSKQKGYFCVTGKPCRGKETGHHHDPIPQKVYNKLKSFYQPHVIKLFHMIDRKLSWMDKYLK